MSSVKRGCGEICQVKEGIIFAFQGNEYENYVQEKLKKPEYQLIRISLERLTHSISLIEVSWQSTYRYHAQRELENILYRIHEIEKEVESIEDVFLREYLYEQLDVIAAGRRSLAEEVKWDIESSKRSQGIL